jgi:hypothetical protein
VAGLVVRWRLVSWLAMRDKNTRSFLLLSQQQYTKKSILFHPPQNEYILTFLYQSRPLAFVPISVPTISLLWVFLILSLLLFDVPALDMLLLLSPPQYNSPFFNRKKITTFLKSLNKYYKDYNIINNIKKKERAIKYSIR